MSGRGDDHGGFGGKPWDVGVRPASQHGHTREDVASNEGAKAPFGGSLWQRTLDADLDSVDAGAEEEAEEAPRRRRGTPEPSPHPRKTVAALGGKAKVVRDAFGVPHIAAKTERDAYAALGFCMAEDRLWQLDLMRRLACGRLAEILGERRSRATTRSCERLAFPRRAAASATRLEGVARDVLAAFVGGINAARADLNPRSARCSGTSSSPGRSLIRWRSSSTRPGRSPSRPGHTSCSWPVRSAAPVSSGLAGSHRRVSS